MSIIKKIYDSYVEDAENLILDLSLSKVVNPKECSDDPALLNEEQRRDSPVLLSAYYKEIETAFDLLCASPKRKRIFESGYQFPNLDKLSDSQAEQVHHYINNPDIYLSDLVSNEEDIYVNISSDRVKDFVKAICRLAKMSRSGTTTKRYNKVMFLLGNMGEGKTIFINYLLSVHMADFEYQKVLPIKIDLTNVDLDSDGKVSDILYKKFTRAICSYYIGEKISLDLVSSVSGELNISDDDFSEMKLYIEAQSNDEEGSEIYLDSLTNNGLIKDLFKLLRCVITKTDYSILYFIDGLDNFHRDLISRKKFFKRTQEVLAYTRVIEKLNDAYILVTRKESFDYIKRKNEGRGHGHRLRSVSLLPVEPIDIINRKNILSEHLIKDFTDDADLSERRLEEVNIYNDNKKEIALSLTECIGDLSKLVTDLIGTALCGHRSEGFEWLGVLFESNNRLIQDSYLRVLKEVMNRIEIHSGRNYASTNKEEYEWLKEYIFDLLNNEAVKETFIKRFSYITIGSLMVNKLHICCPRYNVETRDSHEHFSELELPGEQDETNEIGPVAKHNLWACSILPNLYDVSNPIKYRNIEENSMHFLSQIRILQLLKFLNKKDEIGHKFSHISEKLCFSFNYNINVLRAEVRILYAGQCIRIKTASTTNDPAWEITELGICLLDNLIYTYEYLVNSVDSLSLPYEYGLKNLCPAVSFAQYENRYRNDYTGYRKQFGEVLSTKIKYALAMAAFIDRIDKLEKEIYLEKTGYRCFSFLKNDNFDKLRIGHEVKNNVIKVAEMITSGSSDFIKQSVTPNLSKE